MKAWEDTWSKSESQRGDHKPRTNRGDIQTIQKAENEMTDEGKVLVVGPIQGISSFTSNSCQWGHLMHPSYIQGSVPSAIMRQFRESSWCTTT